MIKSRVAVTVHTERKNKIRIISIRKATRNEKKSTSQKSQTDLKWVDSLDDEDIDFSDYPEITPGMFAKAVVRKGLKPLPRKAQITLRMDADVLEWFKKQGRGYQTRINELLRAYMKAKKKHLKA